MEILLMLRQPLLPPDTGGKVRSLNIFSRLAKRAAIDAVSFADSKTDREGIKAMSQIFRRYVQVPWHEAAKSSLRFSLNVLANQFKPLPYTLAKCDRRRYRNAAETLASRNHYDILLCDFLHTAVPLLECPCKPKVVFEHNVEFLLRKRRWELETHRLRKWILRNEWEKTRAAEARVCRTFDHTICVSPGDADTLRTGFGIDSVSVIPTGVDTDFFRPFEGMPRSRQLVFVGSMDWDPNEDGVIWFLQEIYPRIQQSMQDVSFYIVGRNPSERLRVTAKANPSVVVTGTVADVRPYLASSELVVVPLRVGGGTRIKIPEAMAMSRPVISTSIGVEGLPFQHGREMSIADQPEEFARAVLDLLEDGPRRNALGSAARCAVVQKHSWDRVVDQMENILEQVMQNAKVTSVSCATSPNPWAIA